MEMAENLIRLGKAYVDDTPREQMQKERMDGIESSCRNNSVEKNIELWKEMIAGSERGLMCCLRGKLDMLDPNKSLRDPVYYRCNPIPRHRIGPQYKLYPTYDFACPFVDAGNVIIKKIEKDEAGNVTHLTGVLHLEGSVKTTKLKLTWLSESDELIQLSLVEFDYLITKKKLEEDEDFIDILNPCTKKETLVLGDSNMRKLKRGDIVQLERKRYFRCDVPFIRPLQPVILFAIPDGRPQTVLR